MYVAPGQEHTTPWGQNLFININILPICSFPASFLQENEIFPLMHRRSKLTLRKIGQGHPRVMIYINFVKLLTLMLQAKFQTYRPSGTGVEDF